MKILDREISYGDRDPARFSLSQEEADAMIAEGFLFETYDKRSAEFLLQPAFEIGRDDRRGVWLVRQIVA